MVPTCAYVHFFAANQQQNLSYGLKCSPPPPAPDPLVRRGAFRKQLFAHPYRHRSLGPHESPSRPSRSKQIVSLVLVISMAGTKTLAQHTTVRTEIKAKNPYNKNKIFAINNSEINVYLVLD